MSENKKQCFVIMPFSKSSEEHTGEYWTRHFEDFLKPLIEEIPNVEVKRAEAIRGDILNEIIKELVVSPIVVADLTDANPNVYWELGVRQSFKHGTVTIIEGEPKLPFDIGGKGTLAYFPTNHTKNANFTRQLKLVIGQILQYPKDPDSRVLEAISGRGSLFEIFQVDQAVRRIDALRSEYTENAKLLEKVLQQCEQNPSRRKEGKPGRIASTHFQSNCIELLVANRYLEEQKEFYNSAEKYIRLLLAWDSKLVEWREGYHERSEKWFSLDAERARRFFATFQENLDKASKKLAQIV